MPTPKYWRVLMKGGRKVHLTPFVPEQGSGNLALCGRVLSEDARKGSAATIIIPRAMSAKGADSFPVTSRSLS